MNRSRSSDPSRDGGAFPGNSSQDARSTQDARSNLAVQPAAVSGALKLKKTAVKIVGAARPPPGTQLLKTPLPPVSSTSPTAVSPLLTPFPSVVPRSLMPAKENEQPQLGAKRAPSPRIPPSKVERSAQSPTNSLEDLFVRLSSKSPLEPSRSAKEPSFSGPNASLFSFEGGSKAVPAATNISALSATKNQSEPLQDAVLSGIERPRNDPIRVHSPAKMQEGTPTTSWQGESQNTHEAEYLRKAAEYFNALPYLPNTASYTIKVAAHKLSAAYAPNPANLQPEEVEKLRASYVFAVVSYVNNEVKLSPESLTTDLVKKVLLASNGDLFRLCAALVKDKYIALNDLEQVASLCQNVLDASPKAKISTTNYATPKPAPSATTAPSTSTKVQGDPSEIMKAWPTQEKREHGAIYRSCVLKGVSGVKSLNQLQALVWGGRLESISLPEAGSDHALVKFLTPEACQAYLDATVNGIELEGDTKKTVIFVDKQPGPNSINDVIQNCIDGDASRCVRATGADDDWSDGALFLLAKGKQQIPRDVDRIRQSKTARGHHIIEFRFGNIYHALNFKRYLTSDEDWEHCSIGYAPDPCEVASGVHDKDADE